MKKNVLFVAIGLALGAMLAGGVVRGQSSEKCDYTLVQNVRIGRNGEIKYNEDWQKVLDAGWKPKVGVANVIVFERCKT